MVVGRASLQHFLDTKKTRLLGCVMNSCTYYLVAAEGIRTIGELKNKKISCRKVLPKACRLDDCWKKERDYNSIRI